MITIKQIAEIAGVSPSTVSHVLNGRMHKMSQETREKVERTLRDHKYISNMGGHLLGNGSSRIIGVILTYARRSEMNVARDSFFSEIIGALENEIRSNGYYMMLYTSGDVDEGLRIAASWKVEGLVVLGALAHDCSRYMEGTNTPLVFIDSYFYDDGKAYVNIGLHDKKGAYMMTKYLITQGHKRIAFLADGNPPMGVDCERRDGFFAALTDHGLPADEGQYLYISHRCAEREAFLSTFLEEKFRGFTALFFASDFYAVDSMNYFQDHGLRVPEHVSVCGFDDSILSVQCRPKLTTVHQTVSQKASYAVAQLLRILRKENIDPKIIRLKVSLQIRDSVRQMESLNC
ncbi:MAG: LacI family transcriptional regulator [Oscillospiraceae bacterium]|jgi:LacI family transcriptional regulator|nr:LacI family transcriptional regulator [Oscillospiraceae bacterium]